MAVQQEMLQPHWDLSGLLSVFGVSNGLISFGGGGQMYS